jgi:hypothetical protein
MNLTGSFALNAAMKGFQYGEVRPHKEEKDILKNFGVCIVKKK